MANNAPGIHFGGCVETAGVTNIDGMFSFCTGLTDLDLSGFRVKEKTEIYYMFSNCENLNRPKCQDERILEMYRERDD